MSNIIVKIPSVLKVQVAYSFPSECPECPELSEQSYAYPILTHSTSYRDGDEGWQLANVWNSIYGNNTTPRRAIIGLTDFYTLESNNQFGNRLRFTLSDGTEPLNFTLGQEIYDNYLGIIYLLRDLPTAIIWDDAIDEARSYSDGSWYLAPAFLITQIISYAPTSDSFNQYTPRNNTTRMWTSSSPNGIVAYINQVAGFMKISGFPFSITTSGINQGIIYKLIPNV